MNWRGLCKVYTINVQYNRELQRFREVEVVDCARLRGRGAGTMVVFRHLAM